MTQDQFIDRMIADIMEDFDFEKVRKVMMLLDWKWDIGNGEMTVPSIYRMTRQAERLLRDAAKYYGDIMPIKKENLKRYPKNWKTEIRPSILKRANNRCEMCGVENGSTYIRKRDGKVCKHVLTIAHVYDDSPENCDPSNLMALCCFCHNGLDAPMRAEHARATRLAKDKSLKIEFKD